MNEGKCFSGRKIFLQKRSCAANLEAWPEEEEEEGEVEGRRGISDRIPRGIGEVIESLLAETEYNAIKSRVNPLGLP